MADNVFGQWRYHHIIIFQIISLNFPFKLWIVHAILCTCVSGKIWLSLGSWTHFLFLYGWSRMLVGVRLYDPSLNHFLRHFRKFENSLKKSTICAHESSEFVRMPFHKSKYFYIWHWHWSIIDSYMRQINSNCWINRQWWLCIFGQALEARLKPGKKSIWRPWKHKF